MSKAVERSLGRDGGTRILAVAGSVLVAAFMGVVLLGGPARASSGVPGQSVLCSSAVPDAYKTLNTIAGCPTTTTVASSSNFELTISYSNGNVKWQACGSQSLSGTTVQLYINGQAMTSDGGSATVGSNGCTSDPNMPMCLAPGSYEGTAIDGPNQASKSFTVSSSGCPNPQTLSGSSGLSGGIGSTKSGSLPFTGSNVVLLLVAAALLVGLGLGAVRLARQRGHLI